MYLNKIDDVILKYLNLYIFLLVDCEKSFILNVLCNLKKNMLLLVLSLNNELGEGK